MGTERSSSDVAIESVLRQSERTLRRSRQVLAEATDTINSRDRWLADIDDALATTPPSGVDVIGLREDGADPSV